MNPDEALDVIVKLIPPYAPENKRRTYEATLSRAGRLINGIKLKFKTSATFDLTYPKGLDLDETSKVIIHRLVRAEIMTIIRKKDTGAIEDYYRLGAIASKAQLQAFLKRVGLD